MLVNNTYFEKLITLASWSYFSATVVVYYAWTACFVVTLGQRLLSLI